MSTEWKLRILNTKNRDAEVHLVASQVLGRNEHKVDLVIDDALVFDEHVRILTSDQGVTLEALNDKIRIIIDGQNWDESQSLPILMPIRIGELIIMVAEEESEWPQDIPNFQAVKEDTSATQKVDSEKPSQGKAYKHLSTVMSLGAIVLLVFAGILYNQIQDATPKQVKPTFDIKQIAEILNADSYPHLTINWNKTDNSINLSGYVEHTTDRDVLANSVETLNVRYTSDIRTMDEIKSAAQFILKNLELDAIEIKSGTSAGSLIFVTDSDGLSAWGRAEHVLQRDIPGLSSWKLEIMKEKPALEQLKEMLNASSFYEKIILEDKGERIEVVGNLSGPEKREFKELKQKFVNQFGANPMLLLTAPIIQNSDVPDLNIDFRAVRIGKVPYLVLNDGQKYFEGARLPNGTRITSIKSGGIYLQTNNKTYIVNYDATL